MKRKDKTISETLKLNHVKKPRGRWPKGYCPIPPEKRAQPGNNLNPTGYPKGHKNIATTLRKIDALPAPIQVMEQLREYFPGLEQITIAEAELLKVKLKGMLGDSWAVDFSADRLEGKVPIGVRNVIEDKPKIPLTDEQCKIAAKALGLQYTKNGNIVETKEDGKKIIRVPKKEEDTND